MSAFGPKRTSVSAPHMSAFGGKADMTVCVCLLLRSLLGVKRTSLIAAHMSPFDPAATLSGVLCCSAKRVSAGDSTAVRLSAPGAVRHDVAHQVAHVVLQISDDVLGDVSDRDHAHDLARVQHW